MLDNGRRAASAKLRKVAEMTRIYALIAAAVMVTVLAVFWILGFGKTTMNDDDIFAACSASATGAEIGGPFELIDETGNIVTDTDVINQPSLLYFGYTFCPDVCPLDNARNAEAIEILEERGTIVQPVFISIDPKRDTPEVLRDFTDNLHPRMLGLTGTAEQVAAASRAYRTYYKAHEPEDGDEEFYLVDHSTQSYLVLPGHGFVEFFKRGDTPEVMADRIQCFVEAAK